jgi:putative SOS response-associated peptidase YedK
VCANYRPVTKKDRMLTFFGVERGRDDESVDTWPLGIAPFIRLSDDPASAGKRLVVDDGIFGLLPHFAELQQGRRTYNARSETVHQLPSFRESWSKGWRCIIPVEHIYELYYETPEGPPVRWQIQGPMATPFGIAGIYRLWRHPDGRQVFTFSMITINADGHPVWGRMNKPAEEKRMVVILDRADYGEWLSCTVEEAPRFFKQWTGPVEAFPNPLPPRAPKASSVKTQRPPETGSLF